MIRILKKMKQEKTTVTVRNVNLVQNDCHVTTVRPITAAARPTGVT